MHVLVCFALTFIIVAAEDNTSIVSSWSNIQINDLNLHKSKAIYSKTVSDNDRAIGIWILGGMRDDDTISDSIMYLNFVTDDTIIYDDFMDKTSTTLPVGIYCTHQCSTTINNENIAIVAPYSINDDTIYELWLFDSSTITITRNISMEIELSDACVTSSTNDSLIYIVGGANKNGEVLSILQAYDADTQQWIHFNSTMNIGRVSASCQFHNNKLYIFGGTTSAGTDTNTIEVYDIKQDEWNIISNTTLSRPTHDIHSLLADPMIFIIGGYDSSSFIMDAFSIHTVDDKGSVSFDLYPINMTNAAHLYAICTVDDIKERLFLISGENENGIILDELEYSNKLQNIAFLQHNSEFTEAPTSSPTAKADIYDQIQQRIDTILRSEFLDPSTWSVLTTIIVLLSSVLALISCCAFCQHKCRCNCCGCRGADDVEWWRLILYFVQVYDLFTDINFSVSLWMFWNIIESHDWSEEHMNSQKTYYFYAAVLSTVFLVVPYVSNLFFVLCPCGLPSLLSHPSYAEAKMWMIARAKLFSVLVMLSGGAYAALTLVNSKMFGVAAFTMGLSRRQLLQFTDIQVKLSILLECIPQFCLQLSVVFNRYINEDIYNGVVLDMVTMMSLVSSSFLIVIGIISSCIIKTQRIDDLEITIDVSSIEHNKKVIKKIHQCIGLRQSIARELSLVFGCDESVIEVPRVNRTMYGCKIRLFIAKSDTLKKLSDLNQKIGDIAKVLSLLFRVDVQSINVFILATSSDMIENLSIARSSTKLRLNVDQMRQLSNNTDYCNPRLDQDDELSSEEKELL